MLKPDKFKKMLEEAKNDTDRLNAYKWYLDQWIDRSRTMEGLLDDTDSRFDMDDYMREEGWEEPSDEDED